MVTASLFLTNSEHNLLFSLIFAAFLGKNCYLSATNCIYLNTKEVEYFFIFVSHWALFFFLIKKYPFMHFVYFSFGNILLFVSSFKWSVLFLCKLPKFLLRNKTYSFMKVLCINCKTLYTHYYYWKIGLVHMFVILITKRFL